ncbi:MAG: glycosyltransferase family 39 protein, partial [Vampirovibrionia bacterium]
MLFNFNRSFLKLKRFINLNDDRFLLVLSILVGIIAGFCVVHPGKITIGIPAMLFFFALLLYIAPMFTNVDEEKKLFLNLAISSFLIRTAVAFVLVSVSMIVFRDPVGGHSFANDAYRYLNSSNRIIEFFEQGGSLAFLIRSKADWMSVTQISNSFPWVATFISVVFGAYRTLIAGSIYSAFMASLTVLMIYKMAKELLPDDKKTMAVDAAILAMFFPSFIMFTSVMLKEATVIFFSYSLLYVFYRYCLVKKPYLLVLLVVGLGLLASLRVYAAAIVVFAMGVGYFSYIVRKQGPKDIVKSVILLAVVTVLIFTVGRGLFKIYFLVSVLYFENIQDLIETHYVSAST